MNNILLIYTNQEKSPIPTFPIGLSYVASALKKSHYNVEVLDLMFSKDCAKDIKNKLLTFSPDLVALSIRNIDNCCWEESRFYLPFIRDKIVNTIKNSTSAPLVAGGSAVNIMPKEIKEFLGIDNVITGDGEISFLQFLETQKDIISPIRLDELSDVHRPQISHWTNVKKYRNKGGRYPLQTKRGCTFKCTYCVYPSIEGTSYRLIDPVQIADEIEEAKKQGVWQFEITDSVFNVPLAHAKNVCKEICKRELNISLNTSGINPEFFDEELLQLMEEAGFEEYSFAPDSASALVLESLGKGFRNKESLIKAAQLVRKSKVHVTWWFLLGHPNENKETVQETLAFIREHVRETDLAFCSNGVRILPGTALRSIAIQEGQISEDTSLLEPLFYTPQNITLPEIAELLEEAYETMPNLLINGKEPPLMASISKQIKLITKHRKPAWARMPIIRKRKIDKMLKRRVVAR